MRHSLGRSYPREIQTTITNLGVNLDELMASSMELLIAADYDPSAQIADLNSRLVNDVIIPSDEISDGEARARLDAIKNEIFQLYVIFRQNGVPVQARQDVPTTEAVATMPTSHAEEILARLEAAYDLYPSLVDRYANVRLAAESALALPAAGAIIGALLSTVDQNLQTLDQEVFFAQEAIPRLQETISASGASVSIARGTLVRIQNWIGAAFATDEALKRLEGLAAKKPAEPTPKKGFTIPLWAMGIVGAAAIIGIVTLFFNPGK